MSIFSQIFGDPNASAVNRLADVAREVNVLESRIKELSDTQLKEQTSVLRERMTKGETLADLLPEAFASVREAARRTLGQRHFDVQIMGGTVLHEGKIAEMKTGEGKTLTATLAVYLNALEGKGVHVVTVNDYLSRRDTVWMGQVYYALGMSTGCINHEIAYLYDPSYEVKKEEALAMPEAESGQGSQPKANPPRADNDQNSERDEVRDILGSFKVEDSYLRPVARKQAYAADITYGTNNEYGFDYLRDNMAYSIEQMSQRTEAEGGLNYAIVDEVDSILIDEARTPLIISAPDEESGSLYKTFAQIVPSLKENEDYNVDEKMRAVSITEEGIKKVEAKLGISNLYDPADGGGVRFVHHLEEALRAHALFELDKDYVVRKGEVIIVDEFTGRLMPGRRYSEGLHQAIEAKEGVEVQKESRTLASITFQNYFRMYKKLAGMTGTALSNAEEFDKVYKLDVVSVPTNKPLMRENMADVVFRTRMGKYKAVIREIKQRHDLGQPVLVGTTSIEKNELLSEMLGREGIKHQMLNAKNHEQEGEVIAQAGRVGQVTIATNMAGRGVDIILGGNPPSAEEAEKVRAVGGLHIIGTERHEARRIDDQLRGRAGRQGDPGSSQFYVSLEDDLMRIFGGDRIKGLMETLRIAEDEPIESRMISGAIESAQQKIEGYNFDLRKHVLDYDEVLNKQRDTIYRRRRDILSASPDKLKETIDGMMKEYVEELCNMHCTGSRMDWNIQEIFETVRSLTPFDEQFYKQLQTIAEQSHKDDDNVRQELESFLYETLNARNEERMQAAAEERTAIERWSLLRTIDAFWMDDLDAMDHLRDSVRLRAYGQKDPLVEYKSEGVKMFRELLSAIRGGVVSTIFHLQFKDPPPMPKTTEMVLSRPEASFKVGGNALMGSIAMGEEKSEPKDKKEINRNDPCPCGATHSDGRPIKYKHCHGKNV
ncbi:MAG: preprotein translocase subunit SecA [Candidatus Spechtbacteria bacterium]|nr:preprotein translocase subunit SecA [Candidatus Spechtbacteria bacterium]